MIIKGKDTNYLVIPLKDLYNEIDLLKTEILVRGYNKSNPDRLIAETRILQLEELIEYYEKSF